MDFDRSSRMEWLETNGTGAFAMGTVSGANTRRY
ncbi:MAG: glycogen debranching enzyme N-terminal domain-containing protein, partial [Clostridia bacterium]|nr:glycogen debranching enzyme N-terminal domain-containing protein [Deltaproteobacteria bacterium]